MIKIKAILQHNFNSLHLYCRLVHFGVARVQARHLAAKIEKLNLYKALYEQESPEQGFGPLLFR